MERRPVMNDTLMALIVTVYLISFLFPSLLLPGAPSWRDVTLGLGLVPAALIAGERLYTLITSMFLHASPLHLLGNLLYLYLLGGTLEHALGSSRYLLLFLSSGIAASFVHSLSVLLFDPAALTVPAIGASGAASGVLGGYVYLLSKGRLPSPPHPAAIGMIALWFLYQFLLSLEATFGSSEIALWAHIGGLLAGVALSSLLIPAGSRQPQPPPAL
ncbi:MAG: rhomboid family intramembrane serine protease [Acidilobaceae archaeon]|nr:rhomboid family intramembrane serine protease [Acidilobaceae archaeon]